MANAQTWGTHTLDADPAGSSVWVSGVGSFCSFEIEAHSSITVTQVADRATGVTDYEIWARPISAPSLGAPPPPTGWTKLGETTAPIAMSTGAITWIPIQLSLQIPQGDRYQIAVIPTSVSAGFYRWPGTVGQEATNSHMTLSGYSFRSSYAPASTPPWGSTMTGWAWGGRVAYETEQGEVVVHGPTVPETVPNNSHGPTGQGEVLIDFTVEPVVGAPVADEIEFTLVGTGDGAAFSNVQLFEDTDNSGDLSAADQLAAPAGAFSTTSGTFIAVMNQSALPGPRRFFLTGTFNGTAPSGATFQVTISNIRSSNAAFTGVPTGPTAGLVVDDPAITIRRMPDTPASRYVTQQNIANVHIGTLELDAGFGLTTVSSLTFHTVGNGSWANHVSSDGVELWWDDGSGEFDAAVDTFLGSGSPAGGTVTVTFATPIDVLPGQIERIHARLTVSASAGDSAGHEFRLSLAEPSAQDVGAGTVVTFGSPDPSLALVVIEFRVTSFIPGQAPPGGGPMIVVRGSGFSEPFDIYFNGVRAAGTGKVNAAGTEATGMFVPPGALGAATVVISMPETLGDIELEQAFVYHIPSSGCGARPGATGATGSAAGAALLLGLFALLYRRQRIAGITH